MKVTHTIAFEHSDALSARSSSLRELHTLLKAKDPGFGGLVRVMNKRQEFYGCMSSLRENIKSTCRCEERSLRQSNPLF